MPQPTAPTAESALAPDHIEATLNYIVDDGSKVLSPVPAVPTHAQAAQSIRAA